MTSRAILFTYLGLLAFTTLTFSLSFAPMGWFAVPAALAIAAVKAWLVAMFFMGLREHAFSHRAAILLGLVFTLLLVGFTATDVVTRVRPDIVPPGFGRH